jgi:hypothetical protein
MNKAIYFDHIGDQDVMFEVVVINTERDESGFGPIGRIFPFHEYCKVSDELFEEIKTFIQESRHTVRDRDRKGSAYGSFAVRVDEAGETTYYYLQGRELSLRFFYDLVKLLLEREGPDRLIRWVDESYFRRMVYAGVVEPGAGNVPYP